MSPSRPPVARKIAEAVVEYQKQTTGHAPASLTVVLSQDTLVVTLHNALSPAEADLARSAEGAAKLKAFHRELFGQCSQSLRDAIERITSVEVADAVAELEPTEGADPEAPARDVVVQVFRLRQAVTPDSWHGSGLEAQGA